MGTSTAETMDLQNRRKLAECVSLRNIRMSGSLCKLGDFHEHKLPDKFSQSVRYNINKTKVEKHFCVTIEFILKGNYEGDISLNPPFTVKATFELFCEISKQINPQSLEDDILSHIALTNIYPYWREFVQSMIVRMGLPSFQIPLMHTTKLLSVVQENHENEVVTESKKPQRKSAKKMLD
jgi:preprotein translocase subunit SecB